jgi:phosphate uptake regulator
MTAVELARLVAEMRRVQRHYFRTRNQDELEASKRLERDVDRAVEEVLRQPTLFDGEPA